MNDSVRLGRIFGIPVGLHWGALLVAALFTFNLATNALPVMAPEASLGLRLAVGLGGVCVFLASILAHEFGHAVTALRQGIGVSGVTLWLMGGVAKLDKQATTARAEFLVAVAGPATSLVLGLFFAALAVIADAVAAGRLALAVLVWLAAINLVLAVFNLLPAAPLDGGRVLAAILWRRWGDPDRARLVAGRCGLVFGVALSLAGIYLAATGTPIALFNVAVGLMIFFAASAEIRAAAITRRLRTPVAELYHPHPVAVPDQATLAQFDMVTPSIDADIAHPVLRWSTEPVGYIGPSAARVRGAARSWTTVGQVMHDPHELTRIEPTATADDLLDRWRETPVAMALVVDDQGRVIGSITEARIRPLLEPPTRWGGDRDPVAELPPPPPFARPAAAPVLGPGTIPTRPPLQ
ncbi:MAG: M50 family metallopeptidase [Actinomycetota bacterium]